ncbi:cell division cycle-associated protein 4-like isoform X2 [Eleutherodactylus coqui]|uniref:cell division cycle-associated protein 4-like isoform X2 n=1 Tax=Eleutherodactylus coqui TaxID=57060 RepID=UPI00346296EA
MPTKGIKRKFHDWEESVLDGHLSFQTDRYSFFRQSLLNMSLEKFNQGRMMIEPSLRRYVLIANTLRVIQEEIHHENPCTVPNFEEIVPSICDPLSGNVASSAFPPDLENIILPSMEDDLSVNTAIASILKELESTLDESCPQNPQPHLDIQDLESKRESSNNLGSTFPLSVKPPCDQDATVKEEVFNSNPDDDNRDLELIRELMLAASCSDNPEPMDTLVMEQVPTVPSNVSEVPVALNDTSTQEISSQTSTMQNIPSVHPEELRVLEPVFGNLNGHLFIIQWKELWTSDGCIYQLM